MYAIDLPETRNGKEKCVPKDNNRVLTRRGARQLSQDEMEQTAGAGATLLSVIVTNTAGNPDQRLDT
jgi:hypothetical protein